MEIGSVASSVNAAALAAANVQARQSQQAQSPQPAPNSQSVDEREAAGAVRDEAERSQPVVNANGQTVGTRVNTTA